MKLEHSADNFTANIHGKSTGLFLLRNSRGTIAAVTNYGARWVGMEIITGSGTVDPVCGFDSLEPYRGLGDAYYGAIVGRYANRINKGIFSLDGTEYQLDVNNGPNHLHGGPNGLHQVVWNVVSAKDHELHLSYYSRNGEGGYPGDLEIQVFYSLDDSDTFSIFITAKTSAATIVNLTNHAYFNLAGKGKIDDHVVSINAANFLPVNDNLIPAEGIKEVYGPFELRKGMRLSEGFGVNDVQLEIAGGYDHCFVLEGEGLRSAATASCNGLKMECITDQPGLQFYSGNFMKGENVFRSGSPDDYRNGFCMEAQKFPDSPNNPGFPSTILRPGETYNHYTAYRFSSL